MIEEMFEKVFGSTELISLDKGSMDKVMQVLTPVFCPSDGRTIEPISSDTLAQIPRVPLRVFCHNKALYGIVTHELVMFLKGLIGEDSAIEIGSGVGTLGKALGIRCTDNYCQTLPEVKFMYQLTGQPTVEYGRHVEKIEAVKAVKKYKPKVVVCSWITHKFNENDPEAEGNAYGPNEFEFFEHGVERYIMLGNENIHNKKPLFKHPNYRVERIKHEAYFSRAKYPELNTIYITTRK